MTRTGANVVEAVGEIMNIIPDPFVGAMSSGAAVPAGTKLAHLFEAIGRIMQTVADIQSTTAAMDLTQAGWQRRAGEWMHQMQTLPIEIQQIELQILGAQRRRDQALRELNNQQRQIEHGHRGAGLPAGQVHRHRPVPVPAEGDRRPVPPDVRAGPARGAARPSGPSTSSARHTEPAVPPRGGLGQPARRAAGRRAAGPRPAPDGEGLPRREPARVRADQAHLAPAGLPRWLTCGCATTGYCEISIPEWMFDLDYPGHYLRRIKSRPARRCPASPARYRRALPPDPAEQHDADRPGGPRRLPQHCCRDGPAQRSEYAAVRGRPARRPRVRRARGDRHVQRAERLRPVRAQLPRRAVPAVRVPGRGQPVAHRAAAGEQLLRPRHAHRPGAAHQLHGPRRRRRRCARRPPASAQRHGCPATGCGCSTSATTSPTPGRACASPARRPAPDGGATLRPAAARCGSASPATMFPFVPGPPCRVIDRLLLLFAAPGRRPLDATTWSGSGPRGPTAGEATEVECVADGAWPGFFRGIVDLRDRPLGPLRDGRPAACTFELPRRCRGGPHSVPGGRATTPRTWMTARPGIARRYGHAG